MNSLTNKKVILPLVISLISIFFGIKPELLNQLVDVIDPPPAGTVRVTQVFDGDTIEVNFSGTTEKVRLIGVDTPETHHPNKAVQCYGQAAYDNLKNLLNNQIVRLEADPTNSNRDRYDRLLRYVYLDDELINQKIIREGFGFAYVAFPFEKINDFTAAQDQARQENIGLWKSCEVEIDGNYINTAPADS